MNRAELVEAVAGWSGLSKADAGKAVDATFDVIANKLQTGGEVRLVGFGTFTVAEREASEGRNPATGEPIQIAASKKAKFKPGKRLRDELNPRQPEPAISRSQGTTDCALGGRPVNIEGFAAALPAGILDRPPLQCPFASNVEPAPAPEPLTFVVHRVNGVLSPALYHGDKKIGCKDVIAFEQPVDNPELLAMQPRALLAELWARYEALRSLGALPERGWPSDPEERSMSDATRAIAPAGQGVDDALAWVAKQPADKTFETADATLALAAARLLAAEVQRLRGESR